MKQAALVRFICGVVSFNVSGLSAFFLLLFGAAASQSQAETKIAAKVDVFRAENLLDGVEPLIDIDAFEKEQQQEQITQAILGQMAAGQTRIVIDKDKLKKPDRNDNDSPLLAQRVLDAKPFVTPAYTELLDEAQRLKKELKSLVLRAKYPNTPGLSDGDVPTVDLVEASEKRFREYFLRKLNDYFTSSQYEDSELSPAILQSARVLLANYAALMINYGTLRAFAFMKQGKETEFNEWSKAMSFQIARNIMRAVPRFYFHAIDRHHVGSDFPMLQVDWGKVDTLPYVKVFLSRFYLETIELDALFKTSPNAEDALYKTTQALSVRRLMGSLDEIRYYVTNPETKIATLPSFEGVTRVSALKRWDLTQEENEAHFMAPLMIRRILKFYAQQAKEGKIPSFADEAYLTKLADALRTSPVALKVSPDLEAGFRTVVGGQLNAAVERGILYSINELLRRSRYHLHTLEAKQLDALFVEVVAAANAYIHASTLDELFHLGVIRKESRLELAKDLSGEVKSKEDFEKISQTEDQRLKVVESILMAQSRDFSDKLRAMNFHLGASIAPGAEFTDLKQRHRVGFLRQLMLASHKINSANRAEPVDFPVLVETVLQYVGALDLNEATTVKYFQSLLDPEMTQGDYTLAREAYLAALANIVGKELDVVRKDLASYFAQFKSKSANNAPKATDSIETINNKINAKDLNDWLAVGLLFRFDHDFAKSRRAVQPSDVLENYKKWNAFLGIPHVFYTRNNILESYYQKMGQKLMTSYPVLNVEVKYGGQNMRLYQAIGAIGTIDVDGKVLEDTLGKVVDEALESLSLQIVENLKSVVKARNSDELVDVLKGTQIGSQLESINPALGVLHKRFVEKSNYAQPMDYLFRDPNKKIQGSIGSLFQVTLYLIVARFLVNRLPGGGAAFGNVVRAGATGASEYANQFFWASIYLTGAKVVDSWSTISRDEERLEAANKLFLSAADQSLFYDYKTIVAMEQINDAKSTEMWIETVMTATMIGIPAYVKFKVIPEKLKRQVYMADRENQKILGIPNVWSVEAIESAYANIVAKEGYSETANVARRELLKRMTTESHRILGLAPSENFAARQFKVLDVDANGAVLPGVQIGKDMPASMEEVISAYRSLSAKNPHLQNLYAKAARTLLDDLRTIQNMRGSAAGAVDYSANPFSHPWAPWRSDVLRTGNTSIMNAEEKAIWNETVRAFEKIRAWGKEAKDGRL